MHWRNIHIQNPYVDSQKDRTHNPSRYIPKRRQRSGSQNNQSVFNLSRISSENRSADGSRSRIKIPNSTHRHRQIKVTQQWITKIKRQINNLVHISQKLCYIIKNYVTNFQCVLEQELKNVKQQMFVFLLDLIKQPNIKNANQAMHNYNRPVDQSLSDNNNKNSQSIKSLIRPFAIVDYQLDSSINQSIIKQNKIDSTQNNKMQVVNLNQRIKTIEDNKKNSHRMSVIKKCLSQNNQLNGKFQNYKHQRDTKNIKSNNDLIDTQKNGHIQKLSYDQQNEKQTSMIKAKRREQNPQSGKNSKKIQKFVNMNIVFDNQSKTFSKKTTRQSATGHIKNVAMQETIHNLSNCIANMKKVLDTSC